MDIPNDQLMGIHKEKIEQLSRAIEDYSAALKAKGEGKPLADKMLEIATEALVLCRESLEIVKNTIQAQNGG